MDRSESEGGAAAVYARICTSRVFFRVLDLFSTGDVWFKPSHVIIRDAIFTCISIQTRSYIQFSHT